MDMGHQDSQVTPWVFLLPWLPLLPPVVLGHLCPWTNCFQKAVCGRLRRSWKKILVLPVSLRLRLASRAAAETSGASREAVRRNANVSTSNSWKDLNRCYCIWPALVRSLKTQKGWNCSLFGFFFLNFDILIYVNLGERIFPTLSHGDSPLATVPPHGPDLLILPSLRYQSAACRWLFQLWSFHSITPQRKIFSLSHCGEELMTLEGLPWTINNYVVLKHGDAGAEHAHTIWNTKYVTAAV